MKTGFAMLEAEQHRALCVMGGRAVPAHKRKFATDPEYAREVGRRAGLASAARRAEIAKQRRDQAAAQ